MTTSIRPLAIRIPRLAIIRVFSAVLFFYSLTLSTFVEVRAPWLRNLTAVCLLGMCVLLLAQGPVNRRVLGWYIVGSALILSWTLLMVRNVNVGASSAGWGVPAGILLFLTGLRLSDESARRSLEFAFVVLSVVHILYAIAQYLVVIGVAPPTLLFLGYERIDILRLAGLFTTPLALGPFLLIVLNYLLFVSELRGLAKLVALIVVVALILFTANRSSFLMLLMSFVVFGLYQPKRFFLISTAAAIISIVLLGVVPEDAYMRAFVRLQSTVQVMLGDSSLDNASYANRFENAASDLRVLLQAPAGLLAGIGYLPQGFSDSDLLTVILLYGLPFALIYYSFLLSIIAAIGLPKKLVSAGSRFQVFCTLSLGQKFIEGVALGGSLAPGVASFLMLFAGVCLAARRDWVSR